MVVHRRGFIRKQLQPAKRSKEVIKLLNLYVSGGEIGRRAVSTSKETYRMGELGGHTANVSSRRLFL